MRIKETEVVASIIQAMYPGGVQAFLEARGALMFIPAPVDTILIRTCEGFSKEIIDRIKSSVPGEVEFLEEVNFSFYREDLERAQKKIGEWFEANVSVQESSSIQYEVSPIANLICTSISIDDPKAKQLEDFLKSLAGHKLSFIVYDKHMVSRVVGGAPSEKRETIKLDRPQRDSYITDDDLLNIKITLCSTNTVEEFINSI